MPLSKPCYEDYVNHAMRFYTRNPALNMRKPGLKKTDIENWTTCNDAIRTFSEQEQVIITNIFKSKCSIPESVRAMAGQLNMSENGVWQLLNSFSREVARKRGLI